MDDVRNRQIFIDTLVSVLMWMAVAILAVFLWWASGFLPTLDRFRVCPGRSPGLALF
jgi:hypothetical protein